MTTARYHRVRYITATAFDDGRDATSTALRQAMGDGCAVDVFLLELGRDYTRWLDAMPERPEIRLVYDTGGDGARYADRWRALGVETLVGHNGANLAHSVYVSFLPRYVSGEKLDDAVRAANDDMRTVVDAIAPFLEIAGEHDVARLESDTDAHVFRSARIAADEPVSRR